MSRHRFERNEKLYQYALRSDWTYSARLAVAAVVIGVLLIPFLLSGNPDLQPLSKTIEFLAWVFAAGFGGIAIYRFNQQRKDSETVKQPESAARPSDDAGTEERDARDDERQ